MYKNLQSASKSVLFKGLRTVFKEEGDSRYKNNSVSAVGFTYDYSRCHIDDTTKTALLNVLNASNFHTKRNAMFNGEIVNSTEGREVLHIALRDLSGIYAGLYGEDKHRAVTDELERMADFADAVRSGEITGANDQPIKDLVNIGIGGSDLGPLMATRALKPYHDGPRVHFVSNIDAAALADVLCDCEPATTMIAIASKTFTTIETIENAKTAIAWAEKELTRDQINKQLIALTSSPEKAEEFGVQPSHIFGFWDWVGGRFSLWSSIGLSMIVGIGPDNFRSFLEGAAGVDQHFMNTDGTDNVPVMMALLTVLHRNGLGFSSQAIIPYEDRLSRLPAYLQQLEMESNGKAVQLNGAPVEIGTCPVIWGEPGTNGQHAFFQQLHQGPDMVPVEFLLGLQGHEEGETHHHDWLIANCLAQAEALMYGKTAEEVEADGVEGELIAHKTFSGNRPSTLLTYDKLTPAVLGGLIALYEHKVFTLGAIWNVNSFDQWGVELGKVLAKTMHQAIESGTPADSHDVSTKAVLQRLKA